jgi:hypothetical protein
MPHGKYAREWGRIKELACRRLQHITFTGTTLERLKSWLREECGDDQERYEYLRIPDVIRLLESQPSGQQTPPAKPMNDDQRAVYDLLHALAPGRGMMGAEIIGKLNREKGIDIEQSTLTSRIIPFLKQHYAVKNQRGVGYYVEKN